MRATALVRTGWIYSNWNHPVPAGASQGEYAWPYDEVEVHLVGFNAAWVEADGRRLPLIESRAASGVFNRLVIQSGEN